MSATKDYLSVPLREFLADTAAKSPTPGGGSVAALVGALAAALAEMVVHYSIGRHDGSDDECLRPAIAEFQHTREQFGRLMHEDMAAYESFAAARRAVAADDAAAADHREAAVTRAIEVPMTIIGLAATLVERIEAIGDRTNPRLSSDLEGAIVLARSAADLAAANVRVNLPPLRDRDRVAAVTRRLDDLLSKIARRRER